MIIKCQGYKNVFRLHHKHFDCNYGAMHVPLDWLLGTYAGSKEEVMMIEMLWRSFDSGNIFRFPRCGATSPRAWRPTRRRYTQRARNRTKWNKSKVISNQSTTGSSIWKSWIQPSVLETFYGILKLSLVLNHPIGWEHWLLGKKIDIPAQFDDKEWVFWSLLFLWKLKFDWFSVFLKSSYLFQMRINDQI